MKLRTPFHSIICPIIFGLALLCSALAQAKGKLLIVGGALHNDNKAIYQAFIEGLPSPDDSIVIIPVASGSPMKTATAFQADLIRYGIDSDRIHILPLAVKDDKSTEHNESLWKNNVYDPKLTALLNKAKGFWFVGGDQMRIINTLRPSVTKSTPLLSALRRQLDNGAIIGGTSAGAAMMSSSMIAGGDSFNALTTGMTAHYDGMQSQEQGQLYLHHGLGFFPYGLIDQHFDRKARLGRLVRALDETKTQYGYAVDENTSMLVDLQTDTISVIGSGNVTLIDTSQARFQHKPFSANRVSLSILAHGDRFSISKQTLLNPQGNKTVGYEYTNQPVHQGAGLALGNTDLDQLLGSQLLDNSASRKLRRYNFIENGVGFMYRFTQTDNSVGYWHADSGAPNTYTIMGVTMDIEPVTITISNNDKITKTR